MTYHCDECGRDVPVYQTKAFSLPRSDHSLAGSSLTIDGIVDDYTHECADGKIMHPFALIPFEDSRADLWQILEDLRR